MPDIMRVNFTTRVLGRKAAKRLKDHQVTRTIRSDTSPIIVSEPGQPLEVTLDGIVLGVATLLSKEKFTLAEITVDDARGGGFDDRVGLVYALRRAGFRFRSHDRHQAWRLRFDWRQPVGVPASLESPPKTFETTGTKKGEKPKND